MVCSMQLQPQPVQMYWMPAPFMVVEGADIAGAYGAEALATKGMAFPSYYPVELQSPSGSSQSETLEIGKVGGAINTTKRRRRPRPSVWTIPAVAAVPTKTATDENMKIVDPPSSDDIQRMADQLMLQLTAGSEAQEQAVARAHQLTVGDQMSSRALQLVLKSAPSKDAFALVRGLHGHVRDAIFSMHGNYVIQKIIELMPGSISNFIVEELRGAGAEFSRHRFGCRVICRLLEHLSPDGEQLCALVDEILLEAGSLVRHTYGNYVIQHILEFGLARQQNKVVQVLCMAMPSNARNRNSSHTIAKALEVCSDEDRLAMLEVLLQDRSQLASLACHPFGCYVVKGLFSKKTDDLSQRATLILHPCIEHLKLSKYGRRVVEEICSR